MPVTRSAEKKMRKDKARTLINKKRKENVKNLIKALKKNTSFENLQKAQSAIDKLAKVKVIQKNKASRLKSQIAKLVKGIKETVKKTKTRTKKKK